MKKPILCALITILFSGCAGLVQKSGEFLEEGFSREKTITVYSGTDRPGIELREVIYEDNTRGIIITSNTFPNVTIHGSLPLADGSFDIMSIDFLSSHVNGWNEFTLDLIGHAYFRENGITGSLIIPSPVEAVEISSGRIRYKETRIIGTDALTNLRNRRERIVALVEWMEAQAEKPQFASEKEFERYWKNLLFPELVPRNNRPAAFYENEAVWVQGNDIRWNSSYTNYLFPEELRDLRNTGALLRDWEESLSWIYFEYTLEDIINYFNGVEFSRTK